MRMGLVGVVRRREILGWQMRGGYCREAIQSAAEELTKEGLPVRVLSRTGGLVLLLELWTPFEVRDLCLIVQRGRSFMQGLCTTKPISTSSRLLHLSPLTNFPTCKYLLSIASFSLRYISVG